MTNAAGKVPWRRLGWGAAVSLLAVPFVAMRFTGEVNWSAGDFVFAAALLIVVGGGIELTMRASANGYYRGASVLAVLGALIVTWVNLAVGIVGSEDNAANAYFFVALSVGALGAAICRLRSDGMAVAMAATATALWVAFGIAVLQPTDEPFVSHVLEFAGTSLFAMIFLASAAMFRTAPRS